MRAYGITFAAVADAVRASSIDLPGGAVRTDAGEVLIKAESKRYSSEEFEKIPVITRTDGTVVFLGDIATILDEFEDVDLISRFNGKNAAALQIYRVGNEDTLEIAESARRYLEEIRTQLPEGVYVEIWNDNSQYLQGLSLIHI